MQSWLNCIYGIWLLKKRLCFLGGGEMVSQREQVFPAFCESRFLVGFAKIWEVLLSARVTAQLSISPGKWLWNCWCFWVTRNCMQLERFPRVWSENPKLCYGGWFGTGLEDPRCWKILVHCPCLSFRGRAIASLWLRVKCIDLCISPHMLCHWWKPVGNKLLYLLRNYAG